MVGIIFIMIVLIISYYYKFIERKPTKIKTLYRIRKEFTDANKLSNDIYIDIEAAKISMDGLCHVVNPKSIFKGYISDISLNPFGFLLNSEIQVN